MQAVLRRTHAVSLRAPASVPPAAARELQLVASRDLLVTPPIGGDATSGLRAWRVERDGTLVGVAVPLAAGP